MKKNRVLPIVTPTFDTSKFEANAGALPTPETVENTVSVLTKKTPPASKPKSDTENMSGTSAKTIVVVKKEAGRPKKENAIGRSVYNTMVKKSLIKDIKRIAVEEDATVADLIEEALTMLISDRRKTSLRAR